MTLTAHEAWSRLLDRARQELPEQTFKTWLEPTEALSFDDGTIYVGAPDQFAVDWNESKHSDLLASLAPIALGHPVSVVFKVSEERRARTQMDMFVAPPAQRPRNPGQHGATNSPPLSDRYTFDYFVIGKSNELAAAAAHAVAQAPGKVYNPLFIYGDTGLGKTHLMQAIAHEIVLRKPETRITFIGTEQFTNELVAAIQNRTTADFPRNRSTPRRRRAFPQRQRGDAGRVLSYLQRVVRRRPADRAHERPSAVRNPRARGAPRVALSVGHGR
jgi:chromosomal replication initiator protein